MNNILSKIIYGFVFILFGFYIGLVYKENQWVKSCIKNEVGYYKVDSLGGTEFHFKEVWLEHRGDKLIFSKELDNMYDDLMTPKSYKKKKEYNNNDSI